MALGDIFLTPIGLVALTSVVPLVLLYLLRPKPVLVRLPTFAFLTTDTEQATRHRFIERLRRDALLLFQLAALVGVSLALATPYLSVPSAAVAEETVIVLDASASMATETGGTTRFARAVDAAAEAATGAVTVVVAEAAPRILIQDGSAAAARRQVQNLRVTDAPGDLGTAVTTATTLASPEARIVVVSDFAGEGWQGPVEEARASGLAVELQQFRDGGADNVGIIDLSFAGERVTATVKNTGTTAATRRIGFGGDERPIQLAPGDVTVETFDVPTGGGTLRLTPGDSFATDDVAYVAAPGTQNVRVLLLTNEENRYLSTALGLIEEVDLTVVTPPTAVTGEYDVVIFSNVAPQRLLRGDLALARQTLADGGGVAVLGQEELAQMSYSDLLIFRPTRDVGTTQRATAVDDPLTEGIDFTGGEYVKGTLKSGRTLVSTSDGTPLVAVADSGGGRILYYGYLEESSSFRFNYLYPVFWKRSTLWLAGRASLEDLNYRTGDRLTFADETAVSTPSGRLSGTTIPLPQAGFYTVDGGIGGGGERISASLLDASESTVTAPLVTSDVVAGGTTGEAAIATVPLDITPAVVAVVLAVLVGELLFLRRRGDL